ncbi:DUF99 family protein [Halovenus marina]|uniref:endonuclease dU n=1 Tax=Halovenus marina TaxID=3396621 RepID=UPI003F55316F
MKSGARALGIAESYTTDSSTVAAVVVRADRVVEAFAFDTWAVGGTDATDTILTLVDRLGREDIPLLFVSGIAPAWYNIVDLERIYTETEMGVLSVSFEESEGLESAITTEFTGEKRARRLELYRAQPERNRVDIDEETVFVRSLGVEDPERVVRAFTPEGGRPEPLRVARAAARGADAARNECR